MNSLPEWALRQLIASAGQCATGPLSPDPLSIVDLQTVAAVGRRFKLDVSFSLPVDESRPGSARFSINDRGEPASFRQRLSLNAARIGMSAFQLDAFFGLAPPGEVQTTIGLKWGSEGGAPDRVSLYLEELMACPRAIEIMLGAGQIAIDRTFSHAAPQLSPAAVCIDYVGGEPSAFKDYWMLLERGEGSALDAAGVLTSASLQRFRAAFPLCPQRGTRRYLLARRFGVSGELTGHKLLWMSEAHDRAAARWAWTQVDRIMNTLELPPSQAKSTLARLRQLMQDETLDFYLYPDLVCLDVDADGAIARLIVYVSLR